MNIDKPTIRNLCTDAVFERGQNYRSDGRIQRIDRFNDHVTAVVQGSSQYDVTLKLGDNSIDTQCTCPYDGVGDCKHVVAVGLDVAAGPPSDEGERVESVIDDVSPADLRSFVCDALAQNPTLRDRFLAQFGDATPSVDDHRDEIEQLFDQHTQDYPVVTDAIDFSHWFEMANQYRERERFLAAATVYRALFEEIDDNMDRIDAAYDHYAETMQTALDGYIDCVLATDPDPEEFERYAGVLDTRVSTGTSMNRGQFARMLDELERRR